MSQSIAQWLTDARLVLADSESAALDAELLIRFVLQVNRAWLYTWPDRELSASQLNELTILLERRRTGEPIAYITGVREFWSLPLAVSPSTLIPRADTETLIEWALELDLPARSRALDLGTGTGAIALALASERPRWSLSAVELNREAARLAGTNASNLGLDLNVLQGSWFEPVAGTFDLIVSNPPYIDPQDKHLSEGDVRFEPESALVASDHGLGDLKLIIEQAPDYLEPGGWLLLEHGYDQAEKVCEYLRMRGFLEVENRRDLGGNPRISGGKWQSDDGKE
ncbi:peptide chain release factor N(5)-glutamine methyltransferase [uncultured Thalassolituus sp.]|uniref:peptide chain release factor N(5)-glutamine methyltransferase n=1 Tax=uncultured Thalassolituus sp. TaxID=285273 RepID=UPI00261AC2AB|nr:peptide chain release factor N(5)-glutamine methyltransferase [uncultured Thalassolituus sp.]